MDQQAIAELRQHKPGEFDAMVFSLLSVERPFVCPRCDSTWFRLVPSGLACNDEKGCGCEWQGTWADVPPPAFSESASEDYKVLAWVKAKWDEQRLKLFAAMLSEIFAKRPGPLLSAYEPGDYAEAATWVVENPQEHWRCPP